MKITFHGVWTALNLTKDNSYFLIENWEDKLQVDCGWGLWLAQKVNRWDVSFENLFITHKHTDHLLWFFHLNRLIRNWKIKKLNVYCSKNVEKTIRWIISLMHITSWIKALENWKINFINIDNKQKFNIWDFELEPINLNSTKIEQFWFLLTFKNQKILFFWDEAVWVLSRNDLEKLTWIDYLICETLSPEFMDTRNWWRIDAKKIYHSTSKEAWIIWKKLKAKNLVLIHTIEHIPWNRQKVLKDEASLEFNWKIIVPNQWDITHII